jgi:hypothetical protein
MRFDAALDVGFEAGRDQFEEAYDAGFATRYGEVEQGKIARAFMASRFLGNEQRFVNYFRALSKFLEYLPPGPDTSRDLFLFDCLKTPETLKIGIGTRDESSQLLIKQY